MKSRLHSLALLAAVAASTFALAAATRTKVTPVQKVIQLMQGMLAKGKAEKHAEQVQFASYKQFCDDTAAGKKQAIDQAAETITKLQADVEKSAADIAKLTKEIAGHNEDIATWTGDSKAATNVRALEKTDYESLHKDYSESIDAIERAVEVLRRQAYDRPQAVSLAQVSSLQNLKLMPVDARKAIQAFVEQDSSDPFAMNSPEADGYEFQSQGVIEMLRKLREKFQSERTTLEREERSSQQAFEMLVQDLTAQIAEATQDTSEKTQTKATKMQSKADAEGALRDMQEQRSADEQYLSDLKATCEKKAGDFESRQQLRAEEIVAIDKAIEILSSSAVSGSADRYLPAFAQRSAGVSFAMLRADREGHSQRQLAEFLRDRAGQLDSRVLSALAVRAGSDPMAKVKKMIKDLLVRLLEEANDEAEHKGWCDTELSTNAQTRTEKTEAVATLHAEIDQLEATISKLTEDVAALAQAVADLDGAMTKATALRTAEKASNAEAVLDAQEAQTAVAQALTVLKEFYERAGEATSLLQQQPVAPGDYSQPYTGQQESSQSVVGMLEVIQADFARLEADTKAAEATGQKEYDDFMTDSKVDKEAKIKQMDHKTAKKQDESQALIEKKRDAEGTQKELDAALSYFDKLKPSCVDAGVSYEDRVGRRKAEIESLQEALRILNGEEIP